MRAILLILAVILVLALVGWISFSKGPDRATISIEKSKIREDTTHVMQSGAQLLHKAGDKIEDESANGREESQPVNREGAPLSH